MVIGCLFWMSQVILTLAAALAESLVGSKMGWLFVWLNRKLLVTNVFMTFLPEIINSVTLGLGMYTYVRAYVLTQHGYVKKCSILFRINQAICLGLPVEFGKDIIVKGTTLASNVFLLAKIIDENPWHVVGNQ
jgi:hypothetical protein